MGRFNKTSNYGKRDFNRGGAGKRFNRGAPGRRFDREDSRPRRGDFEPTTVICAKCGKSCEIPFRPTGDRPVYCKECFRQTGPSDNDFAPRGRHDDRQESRPSSDELDKINRKLDKIMKELGIE